MTPIAHISTPFADKFGVPRQAGLVDAPALLVFEPDYRVPEAVRGLEEFDYVWLLWQFHLNPNQPWNPTVRPPRLGGNRRMGVFATRSPFRPNPIGLSCVRLTGIEQHASLGPVLHLEGADLVDGTPVFDVKPYLPYADSHPNARAGYAPTAPEAPLQVADPQGLLAQLPADQAHALVQALSLDPRPHYHHDPTRRYGFRFAGHEVHFCVDGTRLTLLDLT